ncbi:lipoprotein [Bacillus andreraoultii]
MRKILLFLFVILILSSCSQNTSIVYGVEEKGLSEKWIS